MPVIITQKQPSEGPLEVLVTGFGPFAHYTENPSWLAVKLLHGLTLSCGAPIPSDPTSPNDQVPLADDPPLSATRQREIHISVLQVPVSYTSVLSTVPGLHQRPPVLPEDDNPSLSLPAPPKHGFDLVFHTGVAGRGPLRLEKLAHKLNYNMRDKDGKLAPVAFVPHNFGGMVEPTEAERQERKRLAAERQTSESLTATETIVGKVPTPETPPIVRGFGEDYREFPDEMLTDINVEKLVSHLKSSGPEDVFTTCYSSLDAGHYLCDFIYYCSLAEAKRTATRKGKSSKVLFMHLPPVDLPFSSEDVAEAIKRIVVWTCGTMIE